MELPQNQALLTGRALPQRLTLHHVGVLVNRIENAAEAYAELNGKVSPPISIASQNVRVCFIDMGSGVAIELVEPLENGSGKGLLKRGVTYYHLGYLVRDFDAALEALVELNYTHMSSFHSEAFEGRRCAFLMSPVLHLIEIIEQGA